MNYNLLKNFYTEISSTYSLQNNSVFNCIIELNPNHEIYKGHFEQMPIAPGVCLTQIIKEIMMDKFREKLFLTEGKNIKFLALINPKEIKEFQIDFTVSQTDSMYQVNASYLNKGKVYSKLKLIFKVL